MKATILAGVFVFIMLFIATTFPRSAEAYLEAQQMGFSADEIDQGLSYSLGNRLLMWTSTGLQLIALTIIVFGGWSVRLRGWCYKRSGGRWFPAVLLMGLVIFFGLELLDLPIRLTRFGYRHYWEMTEQTLPEWFGDYGKSLLVSLIIGGVLYIGFYLLVRWLPRWWWAPAATGISVSAVVFAALLPLVVAPLFNTFTPLSQTKYAHMEKNIRKLADRAGVPVQEVYVADASRQSKHTNAYFTGFGATQQIVLYDTLLKEHPDDEIESIMAHEIGHWLHAHIVKGIVFGSIGAFLGCFLLSRLLLWAVNRRPFYLTAPYDPAGWPAIVLAVCLSEWAIMPVMNIVSRHFEYEADYTALELAGKPKAFIDAEKRLARVNVMNVAPTRLSVWLFSTHPTVVDRIRMAQEWQQKQ